MARLCLIVLCSLVLVVAGQLDHPCDGSCHEEQMVCDPGAPPQTSNCGCYTCSCGVEKDSQLTFMFCCIQTTNSAPISVAADCKAIVDTDECVWKTVKKENPTVECTASSGGDGGF